MPRDKEGSIRKVFMLPADLIDRITTFQREMGLPSEVEAVRRLLEDALRHRDGWWEITERFRQKLAEVRTLADATREVLVGHPSISSISLDRRKLTFSMMTGETIEAHPNGKIEVRDPSGKTLVEAMSFKFDNEGHIQNLEMPF